MIGPLLAAIVFVFGSAVGSFMNVVLDRLPRGLSLWTPPSHCAACGRRLPPLQLIPIVSYLFLRGRCRACGAAIGRRVLVVEIAGGVLALFSFVFYGPTIAALLAMTYASFFLVLSIMDIEHRQVYALIVLPALTAAAIGSLWWPPAGGPTGALLGAAIAGIPYALLYAVAGRIYGAGKGMGLGDVKVALLLGLVTGFPGALVGLYAAILAGGAIGVALLLAGKRRRRDAVPTVPILAVGALVGYLWQQGILYVLWRIATQTT